MVHKLVNIEPMGNNIRRILSTYLFIERSSGQLDYGKSVAIHILLSVNLDLWGWETGFCQVFFLNPVKYMLAEFPKIAFEFCLKLLIWLD